MATEVDPCNCGIPRRDFDNRCLKCKQPIASERAAKLSFDRNLLDIPECECSESIQQQLGSRTTELEGLFLCNSCNNKLSKLFQEVLSARQKEAEDKILEQAKARKQRLENEIEAIQLQVENGEPIYLYKTVYLSVDSFNVIGDSVTKLASFDDSDVQRLGIMGWKVVEAVPRTSGTTLENLNGLGKVWAGGIGGSVVGSYILMELVVTASNFKQSRPFIEEILARKSG